MIDFFMEGVGLTAGVCAFGEFVAVKYSAKNISLTLQGAGLIPSSVCRPHYRLYGCSKIPNGQLPPVSQLHNCQTPNVCIYIYLFILFYFLGGASKSQKAARHIAR